MLGIAIVIQKHQGCRGMCCRRIYQKYTKTCTNIAAKELGAWIRQIDGSNGAKLSKKRNRNYSNDLSYSDIALHPVTDDDQRVLLNAKNFTDLIRQLPTGYQTIFNLHAVEVYHVEIGQMLGIHEGTSVTVLKKQNHWRHG